MIVLVLMPLSLLPLVHPTRSPRVLKPGGPMVGSALRAGGVSVPGYAGGNVAASVRVSESTIVGGSGPAAFSLLARARP